MALILQVLNYLSLSLYPQVEEVMEWIEADADGKAMTADEFLEKKKQLEEAVQPTMDKVWPSYNNHSLISSNPIISQLFFFQSAAVPSTS